MAMHDVIIGTSHYEVDLAADGSILVNGTRVEPDIRRQGKHVFSVIIEGVPYRVVLLRREAGKYETLLDGIPADVLVESERARLLRRFSTNAATSTGRTEIRAPMPALVVKVEASAGDSVEQGGGLLVLEAMKMENELRAPRSAMVREVCVAPGITVEKGALLMVLE